MVKKSLSQPRCSRFEKRTVKTVEAGERI